MKRPIIPKIDIDKSEKLWLNKIYESLKEGKGITYRKMISDNFKSLPKDFNPNDIDERFLQYGEQLTIVAINQLDPNRNILGTTNNVISSIRELLIEDPEKEEFTAEEISLKSKINVEEVEFILGMIGQYGRFWGSASGSSNGIGYRSIRIDGSREYINQYLYFNNIEELILNSFGKDLDKSRNIKTANRKGRRKSVLAKSGFKGIGGIRYEIDEEDDSVDYNFNPIFQSKVERIDKSLCFVLMPFTESWSSRVYTKLIKPTVEALGLQCLRADNLIGPIVVEDIWTKINQCAFIIGDVTGRNPNVMYELGIVHTVGKPTILITQEIDKIPFDFVHLRHHPYEDNFEGFESFNKKLNEMIRSLYKDYFPEFDLKKLM